MLAVLCFALFALFTAPAVAADSLPSIAQKTQGLEQRSGLLALYIDTKGGQIYMEIPKPGTEALYVLSLPAGLGSNDVGLDRGEIDSGRIVRFERRGPKVLMVEPNESYRAVTRDEAERSDVETSFAVSVLAGLPVVAQTDQRVLVDVTGLALSDSYGAGKALAARNQGNYRLDKMRSALDESQTKSFPKNTEITSTLTFEGDNPGDFVRDVVPTPEALTISERQSFIALPDSGFLPRRYDPRAGFFALEFSDYAAPFSRPLTERFIYRWRLQKRNPNAAVSEPVQPLVYYVERGAPEPVRTALLQGASWWNAAFEAAGFRNAFRVELLPVGADPMDVRYNVIQWVHRATRGYSIGRSVADPRTGEIIKANVTLGSLRDRQDYLIGTALLSPYAHGDEEPAVLQALVLARLRQLAAHEVGHTLGLEHNYIANAQGRTSVMGYPQPFVELKPNGSLDFSHAYSEGIGPWDKVAITWGYTQFAAGTNEPAQLDSIIAKARANGMTLLTDQDATANAEPQAARWNNGSDAIAELERMMQIRSVALARFGEHAIRTGDPLATMEESLVPLYLYHRYQSLAAIASLGGQVYAYSLRGDGTQPLEPVAASAQLRALHAVLATVSPQALALPRGVLQRLPPRPAGYDATRELFARSTGIVFDAISPATAAANMIFESILDRERAARLVQQHALDPALPGLTEVLGISGKTVFASPPADGYSRAIVFAVRRAFVESTIELAKTAPSAQVRAESSAYLRSLPAGLNARLGADTSERAVSQLLADDIRRFVNRPFDPKSQPPPLSVPPGAPI